MFRIVDQNGNPVASDLKTRPYAQEILTYKYPNSGYTIQEYTPSVGGPGKDPIEKKN